MTPLERLIRAEIAASGPMSVARYMALCLGHPEHGYYICRDPLGGAGDFTTAPEISQMFGEMIGLWLADRWRALGSPDPVRLVELGPGRGTLMADVLRAAASTGLSAAAEVWLVETSPVLRAEQARRVPGAQWATALGEVPDGPALIVANEFVDALPVHQFLLTPEGWRERLIGLREGALVWGMSEPLPAPVGAPQAAHRASARSRRPLDGATGRGSASRSARGDVAPDWLERSPAAETVLGEIGDRVSQGGAALVIDYGYRQADGPPGPTLQAIRAQAPDDPLTAPGEADLTWLPDFDALAGAAAPAEAWLIEQGAFLARLGIGQRAAALAEADPTAAGAVADALDRLTAPAGMGTLFKVLALQARGLGTPPGFDAPAGAEEGSARA